MTLRENFSAAGGVKVLASSSMDNVRPNSGFSKANISSYSNKLADVRDGMEDVKLTPNALKNLAKEQRGNLNNVAAQNLGRPDYD